MPCPRFTDEKAIWEGISGLTTVTQSEVEYLAFEPRSLYLESPCPQPLSYTPSKDEIPNYIKEMG